MGSSRSADHGNDPATAATALATAPRTFCVAAAILEGFLAPAVLRAVFLPANLVAAARAAVLRFPAFTAVLRFAAEDVVLRAVFAARFTVGRRAAAVFVRFLDRAAADPAVFRFATPPSSERCPLWVP